MLNSEPFVFKIPGYNPNEIFENFVDKFGKTLFRIQIITHGKKVRSAENYLSTRRWETATFEDAMHLLLDEDNDVTLIDSGTDVIQYLNKSEFGINLNRNSWPGIFQKCLSKLQSPHRFFWVSSSGSFTPAHFDMQDNYNIQLTGSKHFVLYPPSLSASLQVGSMPLNKLYSPYDLLENRIFPKERREFVTYPGDVLYIPKSWIHTVNTLQDSMNLAQWYPSAGTIFTHFITRSNS